MGRNLGREQERALAAARSAATRAEIAWALADGGKAAVIDSLLALLHDPNQTVLVRALACAGLGAVGDLELRPSLSLLSSAAHSPLGGSALMHTVRSIR